MYDWNEHNYASDSRVINARKQRVFDGGMDYKRMQFIFVTEDEDGVETAHSLPTRMQVCPTCDGRGTHVSPGVDAGGYDGSDEDYDPETGESLYWSGAYDVTCHTCHGRNVVPSIDRTAADKATLSLWDRREEEDEEYEAVCRAERMMGA